MVIGNHWHHWKLSSLRMFSSRTGFEKKICWWLSAGMKLIIRCLTSPADLPEPWAFY